jgi:hypothetical protein
MNIRLGLRDWLTRSVTRSLPPQLPEGPARERHNRSLWYDAQLQAKAMAAGCSPGGTPPPAPTPHPLPAVPATPNWLAWIQTALLAGVLLCVLPVHFQGCALPWPHPSPAPTPGDLFTQSLQAAYTADPAGDKAASLALLQQVWVQAGTAATDTSLKTLGDLYTKLHTAANTVLGDKLTGVRKVIEGELNRQLPTQSATALDDAVRAKCQAQFQRTATALRGIK